MGSEARPFGMMDSEGISEDTSEDMLTPKALPSSMGLDKQLSENPDIWVIAAVENSDDHVHSGPLENDFLEDIITKPKGILGKPSSGGYSLSRILGWTVEDYKAIRVYLLLSFFQILPTMSPGISPRTGQKPPRTCE
jgi:hypothetical protein